MGAIIYKDKVYGVGGSIIEGYYKVADGKFYEESTYETEIPGAEDLLYIDLTSKMQFIFDGTNFVNITDDQTPTVTEASSRTNIASGDTLKTIIGKIKKFFADLGTAAFKNTTDSYSGTGTDPVTGKAVKEGLDTLITETDTTNTKPYLYRASQTTGDRLYDKLVGCSFAVNQLANFESSEIPSSSNGVTYVYTDGKSVKLTGTATANEERSGWFGLSESTTIAEHKYLFISRVVSGTASKTVYCGLFDYNRTQAVGSATIVIAPSSSALYHRLYTKVQNGTVLTNYIISFIAVDLTQMFGTAIADEAYAKEQASAGSGIAWLKSYGFFTKDYYPYNAGSLVSVKPTAHRFTGINLFGGKRIYDTMIKNFPSNTITIQDDSITFGVGSSTFDKQIIEGIFESNTVYTFIIKWKTNNASNAYLNLQIKYTDGTFTRLTDPDGHASSSGTAAFVSQSNKTISCLCADWSAGSTTIYTNSSGVFKGAKSVSDFEPYTEYTYPLTTELRGVPTIVNGEIVYDGDINKGDGVTQRKYGIVDLGTLTFSNAGVTSVFSCSLSGRKTGACKMIISNYYTYSNPYASGNDKCYIENDDAGATQIYFKDSAYTSYTDFKTAMSGVYLVYELATPTTESSTPFTNPQICDKNGTEEYIDSRDMPIPVGHDTKYVDVPDWMGEGYYKDFRDRADSLFSPSVEVIATNVGSVPVYVTQSQLERYSMIAMVVFAKPFSSQSKIMAGTTYILTKSLVDGMAIQLDLSKTYNTSEITYYTGYFAIMLGSDLHHVDIYGIR